MPNLKAKYIIDENGDRVAPITHIDAVRDSNGDSLGTILESKADSTDVSDLQDLIPVQATTSNQLADKDFVNSSVSTATATYRGCYNLVSDLSLTTQASHGQIETALGTAISDTPDNNDYAFVQIPTDDTTPTEIASVERYKFNGTLWSFEYTLNNSGFTAAQWAAVNSNITSGLVTKLNALSTNSQNTVANLFGMDSNGNFQNISAASLASVLGVTSYNITTNVISPYASFETSIPTGSYCAGIVISAGHVGIAGNYAGNIMAYVCGDGLHATELWGYASGTGAKPTLSESNGHLVINNPMGAYLQYTVYYQ